MDVSEAFAPIGVVVRSGDLELRGLDDNSLVALAELARAGVHDPRFMPFIVPWTDVADADLVGGFLQYHWGCRASFTPEKWTLNLGTWWRGELVGTQGISTENYPVTRTGETGSWLGLAHQGQGIGTAMRRAICALMFDELGARSISSSAFVDNPSSLAVSRKVGYRSTEVRTVIRRGVETGSQQLILTPDEFDRGGSGYAYAGMRPLRAHLGLSC